MSIGYAYMMGTRERQSDHERPVMRPAINDKQRRHRTATSKALIRAVRYCKGCGRGQLPSKHETGDGTRFWVCRYCCHIAATSTDTSKKGPP